MKHFSLILLLSAFLWSTSGIGMLMHYCGGKLKQSSFYGMGATNSCHVEKLETCTAHVNGHTGCCIHKEEVDPQDTFRKDMVKDCCQDQFFFLKIADEFLALNSLDMGKTQAVSVMDMLRLYAWDAACFFQPENPPFRHQALALHEVPISILFQQFRL